MTSKLYSERKTERRFFGLRSERPQAKPGQALVLTGNGGTMVLQAGTRATAGEAVWGAYDTVYEVDMGQKEVAFTCSAPAKGGDVAFLANFSASYRVSDPAAVVDRRIEDPTPIIRRVVTDAISQVTGGFDIEDVQGASAAVRESLGKRNFSKEMPFVLETPLVALELDSKAKEYLSKRRDMERQTKLARGSTDLTTATADAERLKREYEIKAMQQQQQGELEMVKLKAAMEAELMRQKVALELEIQKQRLEVYKPMIQEGMWGVLVQQLAQNPADIGRVTEVMIQMHGQKVAADVSMLQAMIQGDMIEDRHMKDVVSSLVQSLQQNMRSGPLQLEQAAAPQKLPAASAEAMEAAKEANDEQRSSD